MTEDLIFVPMSQGGVAARIGMVVGLEMERLRLNESPPNERLTKEFATFYSKDDTRGNSHSVNA
jgi:hypothetical protein